MLHASPLLRRRIGADCRATDELSEGLASSLENEALRTTLGRDPLRRALRAALSSPLDLLQGVLLLLEVLLQQGDDL